jgi:hypothetical protein
VTACLCAPFHVPTSLTVIKIHCLCNFVHNTFRKMAKGGEGVVIVSACRTAVGSFMGTLSSLPAHQLGETVIRNALEV